MGSATVVCAAHTDSREVVANESVQVLTHEQKTEKNPIFSFDWESVILYLFSLD